MDSSKLRPVVIDGSNVAMRHGNGQVFSCRGIQLVVDYFKNRGHDHIRVFVPEWRKESSRPETPISNQHILDCLEKEGILLYTPSRKIRIASYDDRYIIRYAHLEGGVIVSNDQYRDLMQENPEWRRVIEQHLLQFEFANDHFMVPDDPLGKSLDAFLRKDPREQHGVIKKVTSEAQRTICPHLGNCTFGRKCRYYHPDWEPQKVAHATGSGSSGGSYTPSTSSRSATPSSSPADIMLLIKNERLQCARSGDMGDTFSEQTSPSKSRSPTPVHDLRPADVTEYYSYHRAHSYTPSSSSSLSSGYGPSDGGVGLAWDSPLTERCVLSPHYRRPPTHNLRWELYRMLQVALPHCDDEIKDVMQHHPELSSTADFSFALKLVQRVKFPRSPSTGSISSARTGPAVKTAPAVPPLTENPHYPLPRSVNTTEEENTDDMGFQISRMKLSTTSSDLKLNAKYPGIVFFKTPIVERVTSFGADVDHLEDLGISISIPKGSVKELLDLTIHPCLSGPFRLPEDYESASPAYLIRHSKGVEFQQDITVKIRHYSNLQCKEDSEDMVFLSASSTPQYIGWDQFYYFKKLSESETVFRPGSQVGEVALQHFCLLKTGKRKRQVGASTSKKCKNNQHHHYYCARLYRNLLDTGPISALFCICLFHPVYMQHCDSVISRDYSGMTREGRSDVFAKIDGDEVTVHPKSETDFNITFDKIPSQILKRDVHLPELLDIDVTKLAVYPPRLLIYVKQTMSANISLPMVQAMSANISLPMVQVLGLDVKCSFELPVHAPQPDKGSACSNETATQRAIPVDVEKYHAEPSPNHGAKTLYKSLKCHAPPELTGDFMLSTLSTYPLGINDLGDVVEMVEALSARWRVFCTKLRVREHTLERIEYNYSDSETCLCKALGEWLKLNYDHQTHGRPSWRKLAEAVKSLDHAVFEKIVRKHAQTHCNIPTPAGRLTSPHTVLAGLEQ